MPPKKSRKFKSIFSQNGSCGCVNKAVDVVKPEAMSRTSAPVLRHGPPQTGGEYHDDHASAAVSVNISAATGPEGSSADSSSKLLERAIPNPSPKIYNSFAVKKNSDDPYSDFRKSMIQMIVEREIYSRAELQQLLDCFLRLNPRQHHGIIIQAFTEIMGGNGIPEEVVVAPPLDGSRRSI